MATIGHCRIHTNFSKTSTIPHHPTPPTYSMWRWRMSPIPIFRQRLEPILRSDSRDAQYRRRTFHETRSSRDCTIYIYIVDISYNRIISHYSKHPYSELNPFANTAYAQLFIFLSMNASIVFELVTIATLPPIYISHSSTLYTVEKPLKPISNPSTYAVSQCHKHLPP